MTTEQIQELVDNTRKALANLDSWTKENGDRVVKMGEKVDEAGNHHKRLDERLASCETLLRSRPENLIPGVGDEIAKNGGVSPVAALLTPRTKEGARSRAIIEEYTRKKIAILEQDPGYLEAQAEKRDLNASTDSAGGYLVPMVMLPGYIEKARPMSVIWDQAGLTVHSGLSGTPVTIPTEEGIDPEPQSVSETESPTAADDEFGEVTFTPKVFRSLTKIGNRLLRMGPLAEAIVMNRMRRRMALGVDRVAMRGTGVKEPVGLSNLPSVNNIEIGTNGGPPTFEVLEDMTAAIDDFDLGGGMQRHVGHPRFFSALKKERIAQFSTDTAGAYVVLPMSDANLRDLVGYDFLKTTIARKNLTKGTGVNLTEDFFGNWAEAHLALWEDISFRVSNQAGDATGSSFTQGQTWLLAEMEYDFQVPLRRRAAFAIVNDASFS